MFKSHQRAHAHVKMAFIPWKNLKEMTDFGEFGLKHSYERATTGRGGKKKKKQKKVFGLKIRKCSCSSQSFFPCGTVALRGSLAERGCDWEIRVKKEEEEREEKR